MEIRPFQPADEEAVIALWGRCGLLRPWNDPRRDIRRKLAVQPELFLVGVAGGAVVATAMAGYDGHRGWVYYLGVDPAHRRRGYGRRLLDEVERLLRPLGCPKINLQVRATNAAVVAFYETLGYAVEQRVSMGKLLAPDHSLP